MRQNSRHRTKWSQIAVAAAALTLVSCGASDEERFDAALGDAASAIASDDLSAAEEYLRAADALRPEAPEVRFVSEQLSIIRDSAHNFNAAEALVVSGRLLEARRTYRVVAPEDLTRYSLAQERVQSIERSWIDQTEVSIVRMIDARDLPAVVVLFRDLNRDLNGSEILESSTVRLAEDIAALAEDIARARLSEGDLGAADLALRTVEAVTPAAASAAIARIEAVRQEIVLAREDRDRQRQEDALARQRRALAPTGPSGARPVSPPATGLPGTVAGPGGTDCPSPVVDVEGWQKCVFGSESIPSLPAPGLGLDATVPGPDGRPCPSPAVDVEGWRECVFGDRSATVVPPSSAGPIPPLVPDTSGRDAARREARRLELRAREERALLTYERLWAANNAAQLEYERRVRAFDREIERLADAGQQGAAAVEMIRKQEYLRSQQLERLDRRERLNAAERELATIRTELANLS